MSEKFRKRIKQAQFEPIKSFYLKDNLHPKIWEGFKLNSDIRNSLLKIGKDFWEKLELDIDYVDIILCGSLCNYNWSDKYSDWDIHIIVDYSTIGEDFQIIDKMFDFAKKDWNSDHDIKIKGFDVEIAVQDEELLKEEIEGKRMGAVYSLLRGSWIKKPEKIEFVPNESLIKSKAEVLMSQIVEIENRFEDGEEYSDFIDKISKVWKKIKKGRRSGLEKGGEFSIENLVFKLLRRNGYIERLLKVRRESYDKQFN